MHFCWNSARRTKYSSSIGDVDMLAVGGSIYEVTGTVERSEAIGGTLEQ